MAIQPENLALKIQKGEQARKDAELKSDYVKDKIGNLDKILFGEPDTPEGSLVRKAWERLYLAKGAEDQRKRILLTMRQTTARLFEATREHLEKRQAVLGETEHSLNALDMYLRAAGVMGQALKTIETPYAEKDEDEDGVKSTEDIMEINEGAMLELFLDKLASLDVDELVNMILEDQEYITMLIEEAYAADKRELILPAGYELVDFDTDADGKYITKLNPKNEKYNVNISHLCSLILGKPEPGGKEKSESRRRAETMLLHEIVRTMGRRQKDDLTAQLFKEGGAEEARKFVFGCVAAGIMSVEECRNMYFEGKGIISAFPEFAEFGDDFLEKAGEYRDWGKTQQEIQKAYVDQIAHPYIENAAAHYLTFNNLIVGRIGDIGFLTATLNVIMNVADRIRRRTESGRQESLLEAIPKGGLDAAKDPYVLGGAAVAVGALHYIFPSWLGAAILAPSSEEKEMLGEHKELAFLRKQIQGHPGVEDYFLDNYENFIKIARLNLRDENRGPGGEKRGSFDLYPGDVKMTPEQAGQLGYRNADEAIGAIHRMFGICAKVYKKSSEEDVCQFLKEKGLYDEPESPHAHA